MSLRQRLTRAKNEAHLAFIRGLPCCSCRNNIETEAAHIRAGNREYGKRPTGKSEKPDDLWVLPLCGRCHREQHGASEVDYWSNKGINPWDLALRLFASSGDHELAEEIIGTRK